MQCRCDQL